MLRNEKIKKRKSPKRIRIGPQPLELKPTHHNISLNQLFDQLEAERTAAKGASRLTEKSR
ncbi:MAG: hypothetical protein DME62_02860 [Verrucomicrobia bacterium]|nr:MAG: hypothetical protein DME62_02860 [Verrucomicrobiota bacterium]